MNDAELKQRIHYLVEHGGIAEDPVDDLKREVKRARLWGAAVLVLLVVDVTLALV